MNIPFSVLDLAPVGSGSNSAQALRNTIALAEHVDRLGYARYWMAEHHAMPGIASSAPAVMVGEIASRTSRLQVGSGGVMLQNHPPFVVAEQFGTLEALHPGRIDLGVGKNSGIDPAAVKALGLSEGNSSTEDFVRAVDELRQYFNDESIAVPAAGNRPRMWMLGSSMRSAKVAGLLGLRFAYAHHINPTGTAAALAAYREAFRPSRACTQPYALITAPVICAESDERARLLAEPGALAFLRLRNAAPGDKPQHFLPTPREVDSHAYSREERELVEQYFAAQVIGGPDQVRERLEALIKATLADEVMVTSMVHDHRDLMRSYEILASLLPMQVVAAD
ncbi:MULTISPECIES: LLM class flavin-dependent oxidoreductase [Streptomyces]|uniref:LLM class flavin-dependent oxidoreductase n=1 Tax=Streptomyces mutomycini TaxID=284036 RepID=A0ABW0B802_9ACTN|nr:MULTISPECIES: LLM class flavin-dependent oxidoreductase [Streptomyces]KPC82018.1 FMN-linked alkanal monooxygenase [Streptomyces sp. NRRL S-4]